MNSSDEWSFRPVRVHSTEVICWGNRDWRIRTAPWLAGIILPPVRIARQFLVSGRVQGVGFRYYVQDIATREGVTGYVRNLPDGRVEAHVEGDAEAVTRVEHAIRSGPAGARVEYVDTEVLPPSGHYKSFRVAH